MGRRGPHPMPTNLRVLHGDRKDRINTDEPPAPEGLPECPQGTSEEVREVWDYTVRQLAVMGLATPADRDALMCYCEAVNVHRKASAILAKSSLLIRSAEHKDTLVRNPALQAQRDAATLIGRYSQLFGLSPSARSEIRTGGAVSHGNAERLLG